MKPPSATCSSSPSRESERLFSPTTRYNDFAISPWEFHWESQSLTREASATGQRYIHHRERGSRVMLFVREENRRRGDAAVPVPGVCGLHEPRGRAADGDSLETATGDSGGPLPGAGGGSVSVKIQPRIKKCPRTASHLAD